MNNSESEANYDLSKIAPDKIIGKELDDYECFFLILAVIYNDFKGMMHLQKDYFDTHKLPKSGVISAYAGEFNGMSTQFYKTLAGLINECLVFLKEYEDIYEQPRFKILLNGIPQKTKLQWLEILKAVEGVKGKDKASISYKLMMIRHNIAFHYNQSSKVLSKAFREYFSNKTKPGADFAYYSLGKTMTETRFFYADAAVQYYLIKTSGLDGMSFDEKLNAYNKLIKETFELMQILNQVFAHFLNQFIESKQR